MQDEIWMRSDGDGGLEQSSRHDSMASRYALCDWQPIATAPREEFVDIIVYNGEYVCSAQYWEGRWVDSTSDEVDPIPTHWMPLPPGPGGGPPLRIEA